MRKYCIASIVLLLWLSVSVVAFAASKGQLTLYKTPNKGAAVAAVVTDQRTLMPIYYKKNSAWVKLADTKNGNVGWAKIADLDKEALRFLRADRRRIGMRHHTRGVPATYRVIEYTTPEKINKKEAEKRLDAFEKKMQLHSRKMRLFMREMLRDMFEDFSADFPAMLSEFFDDEGDMMPARTRSAVRNGTAATPAPGWWERLKARLSGD